MVSGIDTAAFAITFPCMGRPALDLSGRKFGKWTVIKMVPSRRLEGCGRLVTQALCKCDCGTERVVLGGSLRCGGSVSCGCSPSGGGKKTHGMCSTVEYKAWCAMKDRCNNQRNPQFKDYGGRGIGYCKRWEKFENFFADMGNRPPGLTLERVNNDKGYSKANCIWASKLVQQNNRRCCHFEVNGVSGSLTELSKHFGFKRKTIYARKAKGWPLESLFVTPLYSHGYILAR